MVTSMKAESISSILLPLEVYPETVSNGLGYLLLEVKIGRQTLPLDGRLDYRIAPTIT